ncbi:nuclear protein MDM1 isoform X3 [Nelusetta ayraudi]|uniref:nuclear protein MDM1 isoform X3 n=1 Tax=Nelusetta ayraudi TaxID=303726 RepID=UPI003F703E0F
MTVRFKSEYQRSYGTSRSRSVSPLAGLRSDHLSTSREPVLQRRRKADLTRSCGSLLFPPEPPEVAAPAVRWTAAPPAAARSGSAHRKSQPLTPPGPRPAVDPTPLEPRPLTANEVQPGPRSQGQRSKGGGEPSGNNRDASPLLAAQKMLRPKRSPVVAMETEYQRSFQVVAPPTRPRPLQHLQHHRVPLFHTHMANRKRREEPEKEVQPTGDAPAHQSEEVPPPQVLAGHRMPEEGGATGSSTPQVVALRRQAASYRRRAWGCHFSRDHLNQLHSEHNALWEPSETTGSATPTPALTCDPGGVEPLELHRLSSRGPSDTNEEEEGGVEEDAEQADGRLPTPRLKMLPVQRTHHDLTTPATVQISCVGPPGGALLVGTLTGSDASSSSKQQSGGSAVAVAPGSEFTTAGPPRLREAWSENSLSPEDSGAPCRLARQRLPPPVAPPPHCIQGSLRRADFQHNGELGLRLRELQRRHAGHATPDEDDRMSAMSCRSAASCSAATAVLERAQRRRQSFWGNG